MNNEHGLVTTKCVKLDECNDWPMNEGHSMCPMVAWDLMEKMD
jgi:hypothetical protein